MVELPIDRDVITEKTSLRRAKIGHGIDLTVGINKNLDEYLSLMTAHYRDEMIESTIEMVLLLLAIVVFQFRDLLSLVNVFRERNQKGAGHVKPRSLESEIFAQGLAGYDRMVESLRAENSAFGRQILPSLKREILSGKIPPYDFNCTMVRTDINNFSTIFNNNDVTEFMAVINGFFQEVAHIVSRYRGLIHEFVGDEVIFYFKDDEHENSFSIALAAIYEINLAASLISQITMKNQAYPFTVKSSLAHGSIRFGALVNGFSIAGSVLIETVRILSQVVEKDGNVVFFSSENLNRAGQLFGIKEEMKVHLKGFTGAKTLFASISKKPLVSTLNSIKSDPSAIADLRYYKAEDELVEIIEQIGRGACGQADCIPA